MQTPQPVPVPQSVSEQELEEVLRSLEVDLWGRSEREEPEPVIQS